MVFKNHPKAFNAVSLQQILFTNYAQRNRNLNRNGNLVLIKEREIQRRR